MASGELNASKAHKAKPQRIAPITEKTLEAILKSRGNDAIVVRLAAALRDAWYAAGMLKDEPTEAVDVDRAEQAFNAQEKVIAVLHGDGYCEVYAEKWITVKLIEMRPGDDEDERVGKLGQWAKDLFFPRNMRANGMPHLLTKIHGFSDEALREMLVRMKTAELLEAIKLLEADPVK